MGGIDDTSVSAGDRDGSGEFDRVEEVLDIVGAGERRTGIDHPGSGSGSIGVGFLSCSCSCSGEGVVLGLHVAGQVSASRVVGGGIRVSVFVTL